MMEHKDEIEAITGFPLNWNRIDNKKASSINTLIPDLDFNRQDNYAQLMDDIIDKVILLRKAFTPYL